MPRMSKKRKEEWALFLNDRNRITYNELCRKCVHDCKQSLGRDHIKTGEYTDTLSFPLVLLYNQI